jgi:hypothetical protein
MMKRFILICLLLCIFLVMGCGYQSDKMDGINGEKYTERSEENSNIMVYKSFDNIINITILKDKHPNAFNEMGSTKEIIRLNRS